MRSAIQRGTTRQRRATCHIFFLGIDRRCPVTTHPDRPRSRHLTMFASASCPSHRRHWTSTLSCGIQTSSNFASITPSSCRQQDPQRRAAMCRSPVLSQKCVTDATNPQNLCFISTQIIAVLVGARFHMQGRPHAVQPHTAMSSFAPRLAAGCYQGLFRVSYVIWGLSWGCFFLHPSRSPTFGLPPPLAHLDERLDVT